MICTTCGQRSPDNQKFCMMCGAPLNQRTCDQGHTIPDGLDACPYCPRPAAGAPGTVVEPVAAPPPPRPPAHLAAAPRKTRIAGPGEMGLPDTPAASPRPGGARRTVFVDPAAQQPTPGAAPASRAVLVGVLVSYSQDPSGQVWELRYGRTRIGRNADCEVCLDLPDVSTEHATITARKSGESYRIWVEDRSTNGTILNGEDIFNERPPLAHGDEIQVGSVKLKLLVLG